jgi:broad specificity phosphatase PhoE
MAYSATKEIFLIRHAESIKNLLECFSDPQAQFSITAKGIKQTEKLTAALSHELKDYNQERVLIVSNQESRANQTARILQEGLRLTLIVSKELNPIDSGLLSGVNESDAWSLYPDIMKKKEAYRKGHLDGYELIYPNGESVAHFQERVMKSFFSIIKNQAHNVFLFIGHQSTITATLSFFMNQVERKRFYHFIKLDLCSISKINVGRDKTGQIEYINRVV